MTDRDRTSHCLAGCSRVGPHKTCISNFTKAIAADRRRDRHRKPNKAIPAEGPLWTDGRLMSHDDLPSNPPFKA